MVELLQMHRAIMVSGIVMVISTILLTFSFTKLYFDRIIKEQEKENFLLKVKILELLNQNDRGEENI